MKAKVQLRHFHDDLKISELSNTYGYYVPGETYSKNYSYYDDLQTSKGKETVIKKYDPTFKSDRGSTEVNGYIFKDDIIPAKARINLTSGDMNIEPVEFNENINSISLKNAQEMDEAGKYKLILNKDRDSFISVVDFK